MSERYMTPEQLQKENNKVRGCMAAITIAMLIAVMGGIVFFIKEYVKKNKKHPNVISGIYDKDKKIIVYDINTNTERMIDYSKLENYSWFKEALQVSKTGDTVMFVAPKYDDRIIFELNATNKLFFNNDSINARINSKKLKQYQDSILRVKQR